MKTLPTTLLILMVCAMASLSPPGMASTPDGQTPAQESVCDPLKEDGVTKGLYGLCVAFCEAHDAADPDTAITETQLSDLLEFAPNGRILKNYNKKKRDGDPEMPCVRVEEPCPCWTSEHITSIDGVHPDGSAIQFDQRPGIYGYCQEIGTGVSGYFAHTYVLSYDDYLGPDTGVCQARINDEYSGTTTSTVTLWYYGPDDSNNTLTAEQHQACKAQVQECTTK